MSNTGRKIYPWLIEIDDNGNPTGLRKPNVVGDPDYIAPVVDYDMCPISTTTTSTTTTTTTTQAADPLIIKVINNGSNAIGFNTQAWNIKDNAIPNPPTVTQYYSLQGGALLASGVQISYNGTIGFGDKSKLRYENTGNSAITLNIYFSSNNGSTYTLLGTFSIPAYSGTGAYPFIEQTYTTLPNNMGVNNLIEFRVS